MGRKLKWLFKLRIYVSILFFIIPSTIGYYALFRHYDVHPLVAMISAVGVEIGGPLITFYNSMMVFPQATLVEKFVILFALLPSIFVVIGFFKFWNTINEFMTASNISPFWVWVLGFFVYSGFVGFALLAELYILPTDVTRVGGLAYTITNFEAAIEPLFDVFSTNVIEAGTRSGDAALNTTVNNSTV